MSSADPRRVVAPGGGRLFSGLPDGQISDSRGGGWRACGLGGDPVASLHALACAG